MRKASSIKKDIAIKPEYHKPVFISIKSKERILLIERLKAHRSKVVAKEGDLILQLGFRRHSSKDKRRYLKLLIAAERIGRAIIVETLYARLPSDSQKLLPWPNFVWNRYISILIGLNPTGWKNILDSLYNRCLQIYARISA